MAEFYVQYKVAGSDATYEAGPYTEGDIDYQKNDIATYEGIHSVRAVEKRECPCCEAVFYCEIWPPTPHKAPCDICLRDIVCP